MVGYKNHIKTMMSFLLIIVCFSSFSQEWINNDLEVFSEYRKWGFSIIPVLYNKGKTTKDYGFLDLKTKRMYSFQIGVERHFWNTKKWGASVGFKVGLLPYSNHSFYLKAEDIPNDFGEYEESTITEFSQPYIIIPINVEYKKKIAKKSYFNMSIGVNMNIGISSRDESVTRFISEELGEVIEIREVFAHYLFTPEGVQYSATFSAGVYFVLKKCLIRTNILYNKNFKNVWRGEYQFGNLLVSEPTRGDYTVSGDYFGLSTTVFFKKRNKKKMLRN